jgi:ABC-type nitrate/sulfonate/bicarbonate transport system substrate-binding protein
MAMLLTTVVACGGSATPSTTSSGPKDLGTIRLGLGTAPPDLTANQFYYAVNQGFYTKYGLNVVISPLRDDQTAVLALQTGEEDVVWTGIGAALTAIQAGAQMKVISSTAPLLNFQLVGGSNITRPKDLEGKKVGVSTPGAVSALTPLLMIQKDGGDNSKVQVVSIGGSSARFQALVAKKVDAAVLNEPYTTESGQYSYLHVIADAAKVLPDYIYSEELTMTSTLQSKKAALQAFVTGSIEGARWAMANPDQAAAVSHTVLPDVPQAQITLAINKFAQNKYFSRTGEITQNQWDFTNQSLVQDKILNAAQPFNTCVDTSLTKQAVKTLGA